MKEQSLGIIIQLGTLLGMLFIVFKNLRSPIEKMATFKAVCAERHKNLDETCVEIKKSLDKIQNNELVHLKNSVNKLENSLTRCETILSDKLK